MSPDPEERIQIVPQPTPEEHEAILAALVAAARPRPGADAWPRPGADAWARPEPQDEELGAF
jgi:hypothetical protein